MGKQEIRQRARQQALGVAARQRQTRVGRERRVKGLVVQILTAMGERDAVITDTERRAGVALTQLTQVEGLTLVEAVAWCGDELSMREAIRLRRLAINTASRPATETASGSADDSHGETGEPDGQVGTTGRVEVVAGQRGEWLPERRQDEAGRT